MNRVGAIDAILSDDVDTFLFGALTVIRKCVLVSLYPAAFHSATLPLCSPGRGLTGNIKNPALNAKGKDDGNHVRIFKAADIATDEATCLDRAGFILIGLLSGGDYEEVRLLMYLVHLHRSCLTGCLERGTGLQTGWLRHRHCTRPSTLQLW